ncbi:putative bifunctional diguanylate cyclase/phosphodiesterase [Aliidiomarina quisquiliarum]|uniref:putative bifunctional diguanylate cyclase/phosphodiesterase n=1 Tax=Aliidiomarina quisquiliarum TaxID=2938947 RepID=UPI00208FE5B7|nr:EAL domain-containing protein [Aliidiomarina quisquiliarum]MCO4321738.1 EAL domain-containing protein [Aliidiomarina quisquiliarum]
MQYFSHFRQAIIAALIGVVVTLAVASVLRFVDNKRIHASLQDELSSLQSEITREMRAHLFGLEWVAKQHASNQNRTGASWLAEGPVITNSYSNFRILMWVNNSGTIEAVYPPAFAEGIVNTNFTEQTGKNLTDYEHAKRYISRSGLLQREHSDLLMVIPHLTSEPSGYYMALLNTKELLNITLAAYLTPSSQFQIINITSNNVFYKAANDQRFYNTWRVSHTLPIFGEVFRLDLWPSVERLNEMRSTLPLFFVLAGLFTTGLMTFVLYVLAVSRVRAQELADTNLDLYIEIEERERVEKRMAYLASHDILTGLANRHALIENLDIAMKKYNSQQKLVGALIIDLDNFKDVNDALGHTLGDELLKAVAKRLTELQPASGVLARLGGDEFAMTVTDIESVTVLEELAQQVLDALKVHFTVEGYELFISGSIGIAISQTDEDQADDIMRNADTALYRAKELGRSVYHVYSHILHKELTERIELVKRLREAVDNEQLAVFYQPKIDMSSRRIVGLEALVRWIDQDGSIIGPDTFIPLAEDTGLIIPISNFVLKTACIQLKRWHDLGLNDLQLSVNLSGKQLQSDGLMEFILSVIEETGIPRHLLELELTEQVFIENIKSHTNFMHAVREQGMTLAIDDFGVGYSSLSYLKHFPVNVLKIDRSFVQDLPDDKDDATITQTIINLANSLDIGLVAEGVETEEQVDFLIERGCLIGQGFLFSRPIPSSEMTELLTRYQGLVPIQID